MTVRYLSYRPRSEKEIRDYLKRKKAKQDILEKIVNRLKELKFVNDVSFAKLWIESRQGNKPRGIKTISFELKQKGIPDAIIEELVGEKTSSESEKSLAYQAAQKKLPLYVKLPKREFFGKMSQFLLRRGFDWGVVRIVVDELIKKEYNNKQ